jgi:transcriptional regulator with XRE-family HTH domain
MPKRIIELPINVARLKRLREKRGLSQRELARLCNLGEQAIWRMENNQGDTSADAVARVARQLRVSMDFLMELSDKETGQLSENANTPDEQSIVDAFRTGGWSGAGKLIFDRLTEQSDKGAKIPDSDSPPDSPPQRKRK